MTLSDLLKPWHDKVINDIPIHGVQNDSRLVKEGDLFIAYPGAQSDGRLFIEKAYHAGAIAIVYEPANFPAHITLPASIPCIAIPKLANRLAEIGNRFYANPGDALKVIGVTGTNGKTTIAYQLAQAYTLLGKEKAAYIGTIGQGEVNALKPLDNTTPDALCLLSLLALYKQRGINRVCMEVSSHALSQHRVDTIAFEQALFTNLTQDHLDYHHTMDAYAATKALLFARDELQSAIVNGDDACHQRMRDALKPHVKKITYGLGEACDVRAINWHMDIQGTQIEVQSPWGHHRFTINAPGTFNIYNSLAIWTSLLVSGYAPEAVNPLMSQLKAAPGRMEIVAKSPYVLVDYAHTPDALENALSTLSQLKKGRLWVVFGCGGDRDKTKRPLMGKAASLYADNLIITSDNPRTEDPGLILNDIAAGIPASVFATQLINREEAIAYALERADKDDIILIAGKGHEAYQQIGTVKHAFSDQEVVSKLLKCMI